MRGAPVRCAASWHQRCAHTAPLPHLPRPEWAMFHGGFHGGGCTALSGPRPGPSAPGPVTGTDGVAALGPRARSADASVPPTGAAGWESWRSGPPEPCWALSPEPPLPIPPPSGWTPCSRPSCWCWYCRRCGPGKPGVPRFPEAPSRWRPPRSCRRGVGLVRCTVRRGRPRGHRHHRRAAPARRFLIRNGVPRRYRVSGANHGWHPPPQGCGAPPAAYPCRAWMSV